jgi:hypothetical protein
MCCIFQQQNQNLKKNKENVTYKNYIQKIN